MRLGIHIRNSEFSMVFVLVATMEKAIFGNWKFLKVEKIVQSHFKISIFIFEQSENYYKLYFRLEYKFLFY